MIDESQHKSLFAPLLASLAFTVAMSCWLIGLSHAHLPAPHFELHAESDKFWRLLDRNAQLARVGTRFGFTEGPVWDPAGFLYVSDEEQNKIYRLSLGGQKQKLISLGDPDGNTYDRQHRLIDCASVLRAIIAITPDGKYQVLADRFEGKKFNSPNSGFEAVGSWFKN